MATPAYKIGAYYFGEFSSAQSPWKLTNKARVYGRGPDWFAGVKDFYGQEPGVPQNTQGWVGDFSHLKPTIGYYDVSNVHTLERHIMQAKQNGISYFNFYWYWDALNHRPLSNDALSSFLEAANRNDLQFMITIVTNKYCDYTINDGRNLCIQEADLPAVTSMIVDQYFTQPNYLKNSEGRPIVSFFHHEGLKSPTGTPKETTEVIAALKNHGLQKLGVTPYVLVNVETMPSVAQISNIEGQFCFWSGVSGTGQAWDYTNYIKNLDTALAAYDDQPGYGYPNITNMMYCVVANVDTRPRTNIEVPSRSAVVYYVPRSVDGFRQALLVAKKHMDNNSSEMGKYLTIYAWNEWHEGGIVEPNVKDGAAYLKTIAEIFTLPRGSDPCRDTGLCNPFPDVIGTLDTVTSGNSCVISGWSADLDVPLASNDVAIYLDTPPEAGGKPAFTITAANPRPDVNAAFKITGNHGFWFKVKDVYPQLYDGKSHTVYAYGQNYGKNLGPTVNNVTIGNNRQLWTSPKTIKCVPPAI